MATAEYLVETLVDANHSVDIVPPAQVEEAAAKGRLTPQQARAVVGESGDAQLNLLRLGLGALAQSDVAAAEPLAVA